MKAVILIALFAFAAQASLLDTSAYTLGFTHQLAMGPVEITNGLDCFTSLNDTLANVAATIRATHYDASEVALSIFNLIATVDGPLKTNCQTYATDLITYIIQNTNVTDSDEIEYIVEKNIRAYAPQLIQEITAWVDALLAGKEYLAGATEAHIFQILLGVETPVEIVTPVLTSDDYVPMNVDQYISEFYSSFFNAINVEDSSDAIVQCYNNITVAIPIIQNFTRDLEEADDIIEKVVVLRTAVDDLSFVVEACIPAIEADIEVYVPVYEAIKENPIPTIVTIIHNVASKLPEIEQESINQAVANFQGKYTTGGETAAAILLTVFANAGY